MTDPQARVIEELRTRVAVLEFELARYTGIRETAVDRLMKHFAIPHARARVLEYLSRRGLKLKDDIAAGCLSPDGLSSSGDVYIHNLRRAIHPIEITTIWGRGYELRGEHLEKVRAIIAPGERG
jgi:hypothetical protein